MRVFFEPEGLSGRLAVRPAKSDAQRKLIAAALSDTPSLLMINELSQDISVMIDCLRELGAGIEGRPGALRVQPLERITQTPHFNCRESAAVLRFLLPLAGFLCRESCFEGSGRLAERPLKPYITLMQEHGCTFSTPQLPFMVSGRISGGLFELPGDVSSQFISGLLFCLPLLRKNSEIRLTSPLQSAGYVEMTLNTLNYYGIEIDRPEPYRYQISRQQHYHSPGPSKIEGDWSSAAFLLAAGALGGPVRLAGLDLDSLQPDKNILTILERFGAKVERTSVNVIVTRERLIGQEIDVSQTPDLLPVLAVLGAYAEGETRLVNAARLRYKESDRLANTAALINALGGKAEEGPDYLRITGQPILPGGNVDLPSDHRLLMAAAVAASAAEGTVVMNHAEAIQKSYPGFYEDYQRLGGLCNVR